MVNDLQCPSSDDGSMLMVNWSPPSRNPSAVNEYLVILHEYSPIAGSRELQLTTIHSQELMSSANMAIFTLGLGMIKQFFNVKLFYFCQ